MGRSTLDILTERKEKVRELQLVEKVESTRDNFTTMTKMGMELKYTPMVTSTWVSF